jgi:hypothetical protein
MATTEQKKLDVESHGVSDASPNHNQRRTSVGEKVRGSISLGGADERAIEGQVFSMNDVDPALDAKMRLVNQVDRTHPRILYMP